MAPLPRAAVLGCVAAAVLLLAAAYVVLDVRLLRAAAGPSHPLALPPVRVDVDSEAVVAAHTPWSGRGEAVPRGRAAIGAAQKQRHTPSPPLPEGAATTAEETARGDPRTGSNVKSLRSCTFEATLNLQRAAEHLRDRWPRAPPHLVAESGLDTDAAAAWHQALTDGLGTRFRSLCLARGDARSGRTAVVNYAVVLPESLSARGSGGSTSSGREAANGDDAFPAVYLLHARDGAFARSGGSAVRPNVADVLVDFVAATSAGLLPEAVLVLPFSKPCSLWADYEPAEHGLLRGQDNPTLTRTESNLLAVVHDVDTRFPTIASGPGRLVTGDSMGGEAALRLAFKHAPGAPLFGAALATDPGVFSWATLAARANAPHERSGFAAAVAASDDSAACKHEQRYYFANVFAQDERRFRRVNLAEFISRTPPPTHVRARYVAGQDDTRHAETLRWMERDLCAAGIPHSAEWVPGCGHDQGCLLGAPGVARANFEFVADFFAGRPLAAPAACDSKALPQPQ